MLSSTSFTSQPKSPNLELVYPDLIDWDQQGAPILDTFQNDEALVEFMGLRKGIPLGDHKVGFMMDLP